MSRRAGPATRNFKPFADAAATGITVDSLTGAASITGARTIETPVTEVAEDDQVSYIFAVTGTSGATAGTFKVLATNNWKKDRPSEAKFIDVTALFQTYPDCTPAPVAGTDLDTAFVARLFPFQAFKIQYVQTAGNSVINAYLGTKGM